MCSEEILVGILLRICYQVENPRHPESRDGVEGVHLPDEVSAPLSLDCAEHHLAWEGCQGPAIAVLSQDVRNDAAGAGVNV